MDQPPATIKSSELHWDFIPHPAVLYLVISPSRSDCRPLPNAGNFLWIIPHLEQAYHDMLAYWCEQRRPQIRRVSPITKFASIEEDCMANVFEGGWNKYLQPGLSGNVPKGAVIYAMRKQIPEHLKATVSFSPPESAFDLPLVLTNAILLTRAGFSQPYEVYCISFTAFPHDMHRYFDSETYRLLLGRSYQTAAGIIPLERLFDYCFGCIEEVKFQPWACFRLARSVFPTITPAAGRLYVIEPRHQSGRYNKSRV